MDNTSIFRELLDFVLTSDPEQVDTYALYESMQPHLIKLAEGLHVAKVDIHCHVASGIYDIGMTEQVFGSVYLDAPLSDEATLKVNGYGSKGDYIIFYPEPEHEWTDLELRNITAVSNLVLMGLDRISMAMRQKKTPYTDSMTGLLNHPGLRHYGVEIEDLYSISDYAGCFLHINNFKYLNQHFGHAIADEVICHYAVSLYENSDHNNELVARLGAASFFALIRKEKLDSFLESASNMQADIRSGNKLVPISIRTRIGVCPAEAGDKVAQLITRSSFAIDQARSEKVNIEYYDKDKMDVSVHQKAVIQYLPDALKDHEVIPYYQPKVCLDANELCGCEALARWIHEGAVISPAEFIPAAENSGLVSALDLYMLRAVCRDIRSWLDSGIEPVCVSVNYSQQNFYNDKLISNTLDIINEYDIDGKYLEIEITESSFAERFDALKSFIDEMHKHGIKVSLDDFGTGYSSLKMFRHLEIDAVKLDKSLFDNINDDDRKSRMILSSITAMINNLDTITIAEGIETRSQLRLVREVGGHVVQGFIFDKPLTRDEFTKRLSERSYSKDMTIKEN